MKNKKKRIFFGLMLLVLMCSKTRAQNTPSPTASENKISTFIRTAQESKSISERTSALSALSNFNNPKVLSLCESLIRNPADLTKLTLKEFEEREPEIIKYQSELIRNLLVYEKIDVKNLEIISTAFREKNFLFFDPRLREIILGFLWKHGNSSLKDIFDSEIVENADDFKNEGNHWYLFEGTKKYGDQKTQAIIDSLILKSQGRSDFEQSQFLSHLKEASNRISNRLKQTQPHLPPKVYIERFICPFEYCGFGNWILADRTELYTNPESRKSIATLKKGEAVEAITGESHSIPQALPCVSKISNEQSGKTFYVLFPVGEGNWSFWFEKEVHDAANNNVDCKLPDPPIFKSNWWVKIKTKKGQNGWIKNPRKSYADFKS